MARRKYETLLLFLLFTGIAIVVLFPFVSFILVSLSPYYIPGLDMARVEGKYYDAPNNVTFDVKISVGPSGGCMWFNSSEPQCSTKIPYVPNAEYLHLGPNSNLTSVFPIAMGRALALNHVIVGLMGLSMIAVLMDILISIFIIYFTAFMLWLVYFLESTYIGTLSNRLDDIYENKEWEYNTGGGFIMISVSVFVASFFLCGGGSISAGGD
ncbi:hypothetical protein I302_109090 [Kwoniella bestiolae CBS 10118]|uniref:Uncharacterized protein n=1 Tax=Kwoniella bestiolae CBS 10118 TaxID=1296100 RepID=A0A1B9FV00_9TREE|nr:hypothetical protein I302_08235 [Kwoniella bestiolae CBS 10118]OCF22585.1 hypothetical protein I302_08235 [Kwoniella bestiolae CBS 10118]